MFFYQHMWVSSGAEVTEELNVCSLHSHRLKIPKNQESAFQRITDLVFSMHLSCVFEDKPVIISVFVLKSPNKCYHTMLYQSLPDCRPSAPFQTQIEGYVYSQMHLHIFIYMIIYMISFLSTVEYLKEYIMKKFKVRLL